MLGENDVPEELRSLIRDLIADLVAGRYEALAEEGRLGSVDVADLRREIEEYPAALAPLPDEAFDIGGYAWAIGDTDPQEWAVDQALWTVEEGRSDLEVRADIRWRNAEYRVELQDILVP